MEKTTYYQLNKPEAADPMRVEDFNQNADKIDEILAQVMALASVEQIQVGSYKGTGTAKVTINLGFTPKVIILLSQTNSYGDMYVALATAGFAYYFMESGIGLSDIRAVKGGVYLPGNQNNQTEYPNHYVAFV